MTPSIPLTERAGRGLLDGVALSPGQVAELIAPNDAELRGRIDARLLAACRDGELAADAETQEVRRRVVKYPDDSGTKSSSGPALQELVENVVTGWRIPPDSIWSIPKALADDLPALPEVALFWAASSVRLRKRTEHEARVMEVRERPPVASPAHRRPSAELPSLSDPPLD